MQPITTNMKIRRPDDWHVHFRDGEILKLVVPYTSCFFGRAMVMPNLIPPVIDITQAKCYRDRILKVTPAEHAFIPLMTCYLTDKTDVKIVEQGFKNGIFHACKLYPANATTNSSYGVSNIQKIYPVIATMEKIGMPILVHGEVTQFDIDIFDREAYFIDHILEQIRKNFPSLKIVFEHITTKEAVQYVLAANDKLAATITPQHLMFNRNHLLVGGIRPHLYCLPILKRDIHQKALREAITTGCERFFLGTDTAPHTKSKKELASGCAGIFNAPTALAVYATVFDEMSAMNHLEAFCSLNGAKFYGLPVNEGYIQLKRQQVMITDKISQGKNDLIPLLANQTVNWIINIM